VPSDPDRTYRGWCCTDCLFLLANGETPAEMSEAETAGYLEDVARMTDGAEVTLGMLREDHECATNWTVSWRAKSAVRGSLRHGTIEVRADTYADAMDTASWQIPASPKLSAYCPVPYGAWLTVARAHELEDESDRGGECECEQKTFSSSSCDVCGSHLGGARYAVVFWFGPAESPAGQNIPAAPALYN
jgi:hypothetical protein